MTTGTGVVYSRKQSPCSKASNSLAGQEIPRMLESPKFTTASNNETIAVFYILYSEGLLAPPNQAGWQSHHNMKTLVYTGNLPLRFLNITIQQFFTSFSSISFRIHLASSIDLTMITVYSDTSCFDS